VWTYLYRAVDQYGQVIDVLLSVRRDLAAARSFFTRALRAGNVPAEVTTDHAPAYPRVLDELVPSAQHTVERHANNPVEADHGRLKAWLRPMRGLKRHRSARVLAAGHAFVQNLRRGHYDIAAETPGRHRLRVAFDNLTLTTSHHGTMTTLRRTHGRHNTTAPEEVDRQDRLRLGLQECPPSRTGAALSPSTPARPARDGRA
jgi:IS6 family transposase